MTAASQSIAVCVHAYMLTGQNHQVGHLIDQSLVFYYCFLLLRCRRSVHICCCCYFWSILQHRGGPMCAAMKMWSQQPAVCFCMRYRCHRASLRHFRTTNKGYAPLTHCQVPCGCTAVVQAVSSLAEHRRRLPAVLMRVRCGSSGHVSCRMPLPATDRCEGQGPFVPR
jgi:hypothetical protein